MVMGTYVFMYIVQATGKIFEKCKNTRRDFFDVKVSKNISVLASPPATENKKKQSI
jgi:hypothetical protein